jgi:hypothetical protein
MVRAFPFRKGTKNVSLNQDYFDSMDGKDVPFTQKKRYRIIRVEPFGDDPTRYSVIIEDDKGTERKLDAKWFMGYVFTVDQDRVTRDRPKVSRRRKEPEDDYMGDGPEDDIAEEVPEPAPEEEPSNVRETEAVPHTPKKPPVGKRTMTMRRYIKEYQKRTGRSLPSLAMDVGLSFHFMSLLYSGELEVIPYPEKKGKMADVLGLKGEKRKHFLSLGDE